MLATTSVHTAWLVSFAITIVFVIVYPVVLAIIERARRHVGWRYFWYGALVFAMSQIGS